MGEGNIKVTDIAFLVSHSYENNENITQIKIEV
jgi:hypothetical protein